MGVVIITGGRQGIGRAFTEAFIKEGHTVVVVAKSSDSNNLNCDYITCDLRNSEDRVNLAGKIVERHGHIDILVNNAGCQHHHESASYPLDVWNNDIALMLTAPLDLSQQVYPYMKNQGCGRIINMASIVSFQGARNIIGYVSAKHALIGMTKCLSNEWAKDGITVNCIAPGIINTEMVSHLHSSPERLKEVTGRIPIQRLGEPEDVVGALLFLCSDGAKYITGQTLTVDGGWLAR